MRGRTSATAVVLGLLASGCTTSVPQPTPTAEWTRVSLPAGARPSSLALAGDNLLVGGLVGSATSGNGQTPDDVAPLLVRVRGDAATGAFRLEPAEPYAKVADLQTLTVAGDAVYATGLAFGGAHSNPRLTVWDGTLSSDRLASRPQEFFTFGGQDMGTLLGTVVVNERPVIFGTRAGTAGLRGVLWTRTGVTWHEQTDGPNVLSSAADRELGFSAVTQQGGRLVAVGDEVGLTGGLHQLPRVVAGSPSGRWSSAVLPVPDDLPARSGQLSRASGVACPEPDGTCWVSGWVRGRPIAWPVTIGPGSIEVGAATVLPGEPAEANDPVALVTLAAGRPAVLTGGATPTLQLGCPDGWRSLAAPPGTATAVAATPDGLYAVAGDALWRVPLPTC